MRVSSARNICRSPPPQRDIAGNRPLLTSLGFASSLVEGGDLMWDSPLVVVGEEGHFSPVANDLRGRHRHRSGGGLLGPVIPATCATVSSIIGTMAREPARTARGTLFRAVAGLRPAACGTAGPALSSPADSHRTSDHSEALVLSSRALGSFGWSDTDYCNDVPIIACCGPVMTGKRRQQSV